MHGHLTVGALAQRAEVAEAGILQQLEQASVAQGCLAELQSVGGSHPPLDVAQAHTGVAVLARAAEHLAQGLPDLLPGRGRWLTRANLATAAKRLAARGAALLQTLLRVTVRHDGPIEVSYEPL